MAEGTSKQPSIGCVSWLLAASVMQLCNEKEQAEPGKTHNVQFEEKRSTRKRFEENPDPRWTKGSGNLRARSHSAMLPTCERKKSLELSDGTCSEDRGRQISELKASLGYRVGPRTAKHKQ